MTLRAEESALSVLPASGAEEQALSARALAKNTEAVFNIFMGSIIGVFENDSQSPVMPSTWGEAVERGRSP